jgi:hypothetical protein
MVQFLFKVLTDVMMLSEYRSHLLPCLLQRTDIIEMVRLEFVLAIVLVLYAPEHVLLCVASSAVPDFKNRPFQAPIAPPWLVLK